MFSYTEKSIDSISIPASLIFLFEFSRLISCVFNSTRTSVIFSEIDLESKSAIDFLFSRSRSSSLNLDCFCLRSIKTDSALELLLTNSSISSSIEPLSFSASSIWTSSSFCLERYSFVRDFDCAVAIFRISTKSLFNSNALSLILSLFIPYFSMILIMSFKICIAFSLGLNSSKFFSLSLAFS